MTASAWPTSAGAAAGLPVARAVILVEEIATIVPIPEAAGLPVARAVILGRALATYQKAGPTAIGLDASGEHDLDDLDVLSDPLVRVLGGQGSGLTRLVRAGCDYIARC